MKCILAYALLALLPACGGQADPTGTTGTPPTCGSTLGTHTLSGTATDVHDGDTLTLRHASGSEQVRLQGIDAPELAQTGGSAARQALQAWALQQVLTVHYDSRDRYGRVLGHVMGRACEHLNLRLLREGQAWYYRAYACELPAALRTAFAQAEQNARQNHLGLWQQSAPQAPWVYRNGEDPPVPVCSD